MLNLLDISTIWYMFHIMFLNALLYEPRYPKKKTILLTILFMGSLAVYNSWLYIRFGAELTGQMCLFNCTLPSLLFFWIMAKHRNGRLLFTFCLSDTVSLEIVYLTRFLDDALGIPNYWVLFILRLIAWPLLEWAIIKWLRKPYLKIQQMVQKGWGGFAAITALFYVILLLMATYPSLIIERREYLPALLLVMILMPLIYWCILTMLVHQKELHEVQAREQLLLMQSGVIQQRMEQARQAENQLAIQRHDLRHRFQTIDAMLRKGDIQATLEYVHSAKESLNGSVIKRWCLNPVLDAVFTSCFQVAEADRIRIEADLDIPAVLHVDVNDLSVVFANALENAICAVRKLPAERRIVRCKCIRYPQLMFQVSNPYEGEIAFDEQGVPVAARESHGFGTRSITAYCDKHGAFCEYKAENGWFTLRLVQP